MNFKKSLACSRPLALANEARTFRFPALGEVLFRTNTGFDKKTEKTEIPPRWLERSQHWRGEKGADFLGFAPAATVGVLRHQL